MIGFNHSCAFPPPLLLKHIHLLSSLHNFIQKMSSKEQYTRLQEARLRYSASSDSIQRPTSNSNGSDYAPVLPQQQQFQHIAQSPSNPPPPMPQKNIYNDASIFAPPLSNYNSNSSHSNPQSNYGTPRTNSVEPLTDFSTRPIFSSSAAANALGFKPNHIRDVSDTHSRNSSMDKVIIYYEVFMLKPSLISLKLYQSFLLLRFP